MVAPLLQVHGLHVEARSPTGVVNSLAGVSLDVAGGEVVGIIGESGSGKTTLARTVIGILDRNVHVTGGSIAFCGRTVLDGETGVDERRSLRGRHVGMVFQNPRHSLNPVRRIGSQLREALRVQRPELGRREVRERVDRALEELGLDVGQVLNAYPHQLSGGMCQRVTIAMAIAAEPALLIADEATSALDVTTQAEVVGVLRALVAEHGTATLFVTHNLTLAADLCSRLVVLRSGELVESGPSDDVMDRPRHPYTRALIAAVPTLDPV